MFNFGFKNVEIHPKRLPHLIDIFSLIKIIEHAPVPQIFYSTANAL